VAVGTRVVAAAQQPSERVDADLHSFSVLNPSRRVQERSCPHGCLSPCPGSSDIAVTYRETSLWASPVCCLAESCSTAQSGNHEEPIDGTTEIAFAPAVPSQSREARVPAPAHSKGAGAQFVA
jgi:hypothetical protein